MCGEMLAFRSKAGFQSVPSLTGHTWQIATSLCLDFLIFKNADDNSYLSNEAVDIAAFF